MGEDLKQVGSSGEKMGSGTRKYSPKELQLCRRDKKGYVSNVLAPGIKKERTCIIEIGLLAMCQEP